MMEQMHKPALVTRTEKRSLAIVFADYLLTQIGCFVCALAHTTVCKENPLAWISTEGNSPKDLLHRAANRSGTSGEHSKG